MLSSGGGASFSTIQQLQSELMAERSRRLMAEVRLPGSEPTNIILILRTTTKLKTSGEINIPEPDKLKTMQWIFSFGEMDLLIFFQRDMSICGSQILQLHEAQRDHPPKTSDCPRLGRALVKRWWPGGVPLLQNLEKYQKTTIRQFPNCND